jgi:hypothetical protein
LKCEVARASPRVVKLGYAKSGKGNAKRCSVWYRKGKVELVRASATQIAVNQGKGIVAPREYEQGKGKALNRESLQRKGKANRGTSKAKRVEVKYCPAWQRQGRAKKAKAVAMGSKAKQR